MSVTPKTWTAKLAITAAIAALTVASTSPVLADTQRGGGGESAERAERGGIRGRLRDIIEKRVLGREDDRRRDLPTPDQMMSYGPDDLQAIGFFQAESSANAGVVNRLTTAPKPLILFVHGGGWSQGDMLNATGEFKSGHYTQAGYHFATINYRLVPDASVEQQAADVAEAVKHLVGNARALQIDTSRIVLMGHSAGAHLVALVGTDPKYLADAGLVHDDIAGIIPLDGAAYDVPSQMEDTRWKRLQQRYDAAFGQDEARQIALSPTRHAASPNVDDFLILHVERRDGRKQAKGLAAALRESGTDTKIQEFEGKGLDGHAEINLELGNADYAATPVVDAWLRDIFSS